MRCDRTALLVVVPVLLFLLITTSLYLSRDYLSWMTLPKLHPHALVSVDDEAPMSETTAASTSSSNIQPSSTPVSPLLRIGNGTILSAVEIQRYVEAILDPASTTVNRLYCPDLDETRYDNLRSSPTRPRSEEDQVDYFFALNLRNNLALLPRLIGSIVEAISFLGPTRCALSIVEGNSPDGTADVLGALQPYLDQLDIPYFYLSSRINPKKGNRIAKLAELRNLALQPLFTSLYERVHPATTVLFLNDVAACVEDILELALQRTRLRAVMTCAMDWTYVGSDPTFYDVWVARGINGDSFFEVPKSGSWDFAWNLFWNDGATRTKLLMHQPFQVYSCWNGAVAFAAAPLLDGVRFREANTGDCKHGEPQNFCKDLWLRGYGKIAVIPTVNLEYSDEQAAKLKGLKGYVSELVVNENRHIAIDWAGPPEEVKCLEGWAHQHWEPWKVSRRSST